MSDGKTEAATVADLTRKGLEPHFVDGDDGRKFLVAQSSDGQRLLQVPSTLPVMTAPGRIVGNVTVETADSLVDYLRDFAGTGARLFASIANDSVVGVVDYHEPKTAEAEAVAAFSEHRALLQFRRSLEWRAWAAADGKLMSQKDFVNFLEENREDILIPDAASLLEVCRDLQAIRKADFRSVLREGAENYQIEYAADTTATARTSRVSLPTEFVLELPVYFGGEMNELRALLRWNLTEDHQLQLGFKLKRAERVRQAVFQKAVTEISDRAGVPSIYGALG